tara:strand:+ start:370 stop:603 length:234 start_codon:yes stop_codon:yes gene_type:complete
MSNCVLCKKQVSNNNIGNISKDSFIPLSCLLKYGINGHRICGNCWFEKFALENANHKCPGCIANIKIEINKEIIDLT